jgi:nicotinamidase/pyrazinamidase
MAGEYVLLIIDPQIDFHEGGNLGVYGVAEIGGKGGKSDSENIIKLIAAKPPKAVYVSLDTHTPTHIGHQGFWQPVGNPGGSPPGIASSFIVVDGQVAVATNGINTFYEPTSTGDPAKDEELKKWVVTYVTALTNGVNGGEKFSPCIWPYHCLENSEGHKVYPPLKEALDTLSGKGIPVEYHVKGQNEATEMYSIFKAELPVEGNAPDSLQTLYRGKYETSTDSKIGTPTSDKEDHANLKTDFNESLYESLVRHNLPIVVCGEALSHCVKWSTNDLVAHKTDKGSSLPVILLEDASSVVNLEGVGAPRDLFIGSTQKFKESSTAKGVEWMKVDEFIGSKSNKGGGRRKSRRSYKLKKGRKTRSRM